MFDQGFENETGMNSVQKGIWQDVLLNFNDLVNWPNGQQTIQIQLKVFLKNFETDEDDDDDLRVQEDIFDKLDGFIGIG